MLLDVADPSVQSFCYSSVKVQELVVEYGVQNIEMLLAHTLPRTVPFPTPYVCALQT